MRNAYITLLANDGYIYCVIALYSSWLTTNSQYEFYCAYTEGVSEETIAKLEGIGIKTIKLSHISGLEALEKKLKDTGYNSWIPALQKLAIYGLTDFDKIVFLDADTYIFKNLDHLFEKNHLTAVPDGEGRKCKDYKFVPGDNYFKKFNAGMVVIEPSESLLNTIIESTKSLPADRPWADQNIVSELYPNWINEQDKHLPIYYNCFGRHICEYEKNISNFSTNKIYLLHLVGRKMSPTYGFEDYFKNEKHSTYCSLLRRICYNVNDYIKEQQLAGLLPGVQLIKTQQQYDLVVPYVDSTDENWQKLFNEYNPIKDKQVEAVNAENRFRGQGEFFRFFFRGLEKNMPWLHRVHLIVQSESQVPYWLDKSKVHIVLHKDFIPEEYLPTFNSTTIEMFLWNIPGLADKFIYANDDMFTVKPLAITNFFTADNKIALKTNPFNIDLDKLSMYGHHIVNGCKLIFGEGAARIEPNHTLRAYDKHLMKKCFLENEEVIRASISKFRTEYNFNVYLFDYYQIKEGITTVTGVPKAEACYLRHNQESLIKNKLSKNDFYILCVQDVNSKDSVYNSSTLTTWFERRLNKLGYYEDPKQRCITSAAEERIERIVAKMPDRLKGKIRRVLTNKLSY